MKRTLIKNIKRHKVTHLAGRILDVGEEDFILKDESGKIKINSKGHKAKYKLGDIVSVLGKKKKDIFRADKLEVLVPAMNFVKLSQDQNWQKIIFSDDLKEKLQLRTKILRKVKDFFLQEKFSEVETPIMVGYAGQEPYLNPFSTNYFDSKGQPEQRYLITSPEFAMKKLLVAGFENIFQITRCFRNYEDQSVWHNPEFTMIEWYRAYAGYEQIMRDTEKLVKFLVTELSGKYKFKFQGRKIDLSKKPLVISVKDCFKEFAKINFDKCLESKAYFWESLKKKNLKVAEEYSLDDLFYVAFLNLVEPHLKQRKELVIVKEYPYYQSALAVLCENKLYAKRFEVFLGGIELANAFQELNDWQEQLQRFKEEQKMRKKQGKKIIPIDPDFIAALKIGMPPSSGIALGLDRLIAILLDCDGLDQVLYFRN